MYYLNILQLKSLLLVYKFMCKCNDSFVTEVVFLNYNADHTKRTRCNDLSSKIIKEKKKYFWKIILQITIRNRIIYWQKIKLPSVKEDADLKPRLGLCMEYTVDTPLILESVCVCVCVCVCVHTHTVISLHFTFSKLKHIQGDVILFSNFKSSYFELNGTACIFTNVEHKIVKRAVVLRSKVANQWILPGCPM